METLDPATGEALPSDAIQRILFLANLVHVYSIPPLASMRGHSASSWTAEPSRQIFSSRLRVIETSYSNSLKVDVVLEDPASGELFAAVPYVAPAAVEPVIDSSRFFAVTVRDPSNPGRRAVLGIGFEDRSDSFDFSVALQAARRSLGWDAAGGEAAASSQRPAAAAEAKDYSLKEGETITINFPSHPGRRRQQQDSEQQPESEVTDMSSFVLPPPPGHSSAGSSKSSDSAQAFALPPPPNADDVKRKRRSLRELGFDDGQFGEFA
ncbi:hypothetical protein CDD82_3502 [Ophiocordyceps australis]|uniref:NECAP PHear domain-containing protein n=1 Tax=Ophiocordyceps australis TaxID=1399860 RepID=A0A2C5XP09_9HYPO|nr:hypothetical protein CDD82_3502 [Ophiocordyceps australis]